MYTLARYPKGPMDRHELRRIMYSWPEIMCSASDPWVLTFSANIWKQYSDPKWLPSLKQSHCIRAIFREHGEGDEDMELIEN